MHRSCTKKYCYAPLVLVEITLASATPIGALLVL